MGSLSGSLAQARNTYSTCILEFDDNTDTVALAFGI